MKATEARLLEFLKKSPQFVIPIYQRTSWPAMTVFTCWGPCAMLAREDEEPSSSILPAVGMTDHRAGAVIDLAFLVTESFP